MNLKVALSRSLKWFADHLLSSILSLSLTALVAAWGGFFHFSKSAIDSAILLLSTQTPLWATISLVVLGCLYTYLRVRPYLRSKKPPNTQEQLHEAFGVYWNNEYKLRCLKCKWPLKCASVRYDPSVFFCSNCNEKHTLRDPNGNHMTEAKAAEQLKELLTTASTGR